MAKTVWQSFYSQTGGKIDGAIIANDGMGDGVTTAMQSEGVLGKIPFTGQDAQDSGLARILQGQQCMTVFKDTALEAGPGVQARDRTDQGQTRTPSRSPTARSRTPLLKKDVAFAAATPEAITKANVEDVIKTGYTTAANVCKLATQAVCDKAGIK